VATGDAAHFPITRHFVRENRLCPCSVLIVFSVNAASNFCCFVQVCKLHSSPTKNADGGRRPQWPETRQEYVEVLLDTREKQGRPGSTDLTGQALHRWGMVYGERSQQELRESDRGLAFFQNPRFCSNRKTIGDLGQW